MTIARASAARTEPATEAPTRRLHPTTVAPAFSDVELDHNRRPDATPPTTSIAIPPITIPMVTAPTTPAVTAPTTPVVTAPGSPIVTPPQIVISTPVAPQSSHRQ